MITFICKWANAQPHAGKIDAFVKQYADERLFSIAVLLVEKGNIIYKNTVGGHFIQREKPEVEFNAVKRLAEK